MSTKAVSRRSETLPSLFDEFFRPYDEWFVNGGFMGRPLTVPSVNITDNKDDYNLSLAAPGMKKSDFNIDIDGNMLTISCEKEESGEEKDKRHSRREYNFYSFSRSFTLPDDVVREKIEATYEDGLLKLKLPKKEEAKKMATSKQIAVK